MPARQIDSMCPDKIGRFSLAQQLLVGFSDTRTPYSISAICRGLEQSRKAEDIKREMAALGEAGYKEVRIFGGGGHCHGQQGGCELSWAGSCLAGCEQVCEGGSSLIHIRLLNCYDPSSFLACATCARHSVHAPKHTCPAPAPAKHARAQACSLHFHTRHMDYGGNTHVLVSLLSCCFVPALC